MNTNDKQRLSLIFKFVETFQNQIRLFDRKLQSKRINLWSN